MTSLRPALYGLAALALLFGLIDFGLVLTSDFLSVRGVWASAGLLVGWGFIGVGLFAWWRRPDNRVGMLMAATGFAWLLSLVGASDSELLFTIGQATSSIFFATAIHMLLAAPDGWLHTRIERRIVAVGYLVVIVLVPPLYLFVDPARDLDCRECPDNLLFVARDETVLNAFGAILNVIGITIVVAVLLSLVRRWRRAPAPERRLYAAVYACGIALMLALIGLFALQSVSNDSDALDVLFAVAIAPLALIPYLYLAALVRARVLEGGAMGELVARLGEAPRAGELRDALAGALNDPSLELFYWLPAERGWVDPDGHRVELPGEGSGRAVTGVERDGERLAAIVHDPSLLAARAHVRAVGAVASLALENERLDAELRCKVDDLRASRERMLRIGLEERRRLERDLHDGAQQRLVSLALNLRLARGRLRDDPDAADRLLAGASEELEAALEELRELARGIHPALLSDRGLETALETLAHRAPVPVRLGELPDERLPEAVELAAYFVVSEALTNVAKYAAASEATVSVGRDDGRIVVEVADDGVGGADPERGTGLRGLADRLAVLEGRLEVDSERGHGTTVRARIPCG